MATGVLCFKKPNDNLAGRLMRGGEGPLMRLSSNWLIIMTGLPSSTGVGASALAMLYNLIIRKIMA